MHIINLSIKCKEATGDGTKIVCLNSDYKVRITAEDCGTFTNAPVKKLIVRHGKEYYEVDIKSELEDDGQTYLQAELPPIEWKEYVHLGVCGKNSENAKPTYTSKSAKFECDDSVLNGVVILRAAPKLTSLDVTANGTYRATDTGDDGYYVVNVNTFTKTEVTKEVDLDFMYGDQEVVPTFNTQSLSKVIIKQPSTLSSGNIVKGVTIAGITGSYTHPYYDGYVTVVDEDDAATTL